MCIKSAESSFPLLYYTSKHFLRGGRWSRLSWLVAYQKSVNKLMVLFGRLGNGFYHLVTRQRTTVRFKVVTNNAFNLPKVLFFVFQAKDLTGITAKRSLISLC